MADSQQVDVQRLRRVASMLAQLLSTFGDSKSDASAARALTESYNTVRSEALEILPEALKTEFARIFEESSHGGGRRTDLLAEAGRTQAARAKISLMHGWITRLIEDADK